VIGQRIGTYTIIEKLGEGGMGEVYRARDPKLGRDVAIKILPDLFAADADRVARFQREAQVLASLNHPHIAQIYGLEEIRPAGGSKEQDPPYAVIDRRRDVVPRHRDVVRADSLSDRSVCRRARPATH